VEEVSLVLLLADENAVFRRKALTESVRRRRTKSVTGILLDKNAAQARREEVIGTLRDLATGTGQAPDQAHTAREVLCGFGSDTHVYDDSECNGPARWAAEAHCLAQASKTTIDRHPGTNPWKGPSMTMTTEWSGSVGDGYVGGMTACLGEFEAKARNECEATARKRETELRSSAARAGNCSTAP
jgi:hypothetical protein